jgi:O-antigen/teichoic acid export membrane protein
MSKKRIVLNVAATYSQSLLTLAVGVFSLRWVYNALGKEAFGLFNVVGSVIAFSHVFSSVMANSNSRFFAIAIGEGRRLGAEHGHRELSAWFNTSFSVHLMLAVILCSILWPVGDWMIRHRLVIPPEQLAVSRKIFCISLTMLFIGIVNAPYHAIYTAKQYIFVRNMTAMLKSALVAVEGWWLLHFSGNRILGHSIAHALIGILVQVLLMGLALHAFPETRLRPRLWFDRRRLHQLFSYASFTMFGSLGGFFAGPFISFVVNLFFGTGANAVIGVGRRFARSMEHLAEAITSAIFPEVSTRIGAADKARAENMAVLSSFLSCLPTCMIGVPLLFWMPDILTLLLKNPPAGSATMVCILIAASLLQRMTSCYQMLVYASGRIKWYQMTLGTINMSCAAVLWILLKFGAPFLSAVGIALILPRAVLSVGRIFFARHILRIDPWRFVRLILVPLSVCFAASLAFCSIFRSRSGGAIWWTVICTGANALLVAALAFRFHPAREIREMPGKVLSRFRKWKAC